MPFRLSFLLVYRGCLSFVGTLGALILRILEVPFYGVHQERKGVQLSVSP